MTSTTNTEKDACWMIARMIEEFPGLLDSERDISGGDLACWIFEQLDQMPHLKELKVVYELKVNP